MVAPSHATFLSFPLILLSFSEASTMEVSSSCVDPVYWKSFLMSARYLCARQERCLIEMQMQGKQSGLLIKRVAAFPRVFLGVIAQFLACQPIYCMIYKVVQ